MGFLSSLLHQKLLLKIDPETSHHFAIQYLKTWQSLKLKFSRAPSKIPTLLKPSDISGVGLAAGFDKNAEAFLALSWLGFQFIEVGTVTPRPQLGNPKPRLFRIAPQSLVNAMGFNNVGLDKFKQNIAFLKPHLKNTYLLANIGKNKDTPIENALSDYKLCIEALQPLVDGFVINVSSPNTPGLRDLQSRSFLESLSSLKTNKPIWVKLAPDLDDNALIELCSVVKNQQNLVGIVATNTSVALAKLHASQCVGGYSGPLLFERSLAFVAISRKALGPTKHIIAVGGISSAENAKAMLLAGANACEIYTSFIYQGPQLIQKLRRP